MAARTFRKKKQQQSRVFLGVIFYFYTDLDNRERAGASYWKQRRRIRREKSMATGEKMRKASGQQGENERRWKVTANMNAGNKILGKQHTKIPP